MKKVQKSKMPTGKQALAVGAGFAAVAAAAAGVYMLTGKNAKNRKKVAKWAGNIEKDVVKELGKVGKASKKTYDQVVDTVVKNYKNIKTISAPELAAVAADLKTSWKAIEAEMNNAKKTVQRVVPKTAKSVVKAAKKVQKAVTAKPAKKVAKKVVKKVAAKKAAPKRRR